MICYMLKVYDCKRNNMKYPFPSISLESERRPHTIIIKKKFFKARFPFFQAKHYILRYIYMDPWYILQYFILHFQLNGMGSLNGIATEEGRFYYFINLKSFKLNYCVCTVA